MNRDLQVTSTKQTGAISTDGPWGLRQPVLVPGKGGNNEVKAFNWDLGAKRDKPGTLQIGLGVLVGLACKNAILIVEYGMKPQLKPLGCGCARS